MDYVECRFYEETCIYPKPPQPPDCGGPPSRRSVAEPAQTPTVGSNSLKLSIRLFLYAAMSLGQIVTRPLSTIQISRA